MLFASILNLIGVVSKVHGGYVKMDHSSLEDKLNALDYTDDREGETVASLAVWNSVKDSKVEGIAFEASRAISNQSLEPSRSLSTNPYILSGPGHHEINLDTADPKDVENVIQRIQSTGIDSASTWDLSFVTSRARYDPHSKPLLDFTIIAEFLQQIPSIKHFYWKASRPLPNEILSIIEVHHPNCQMHMNLDLGDSFDTLDSTKRDLQHDRDAREALIGSKTLFSLTASISYGGTGDAESMDLVHRILISCPNIRQLSLSVHHSGCLVTSDAQPCAFDFERYKDALPPLQSLTLSGYGFYHKPNGLKWMEWETANPRNNILHFPWSRLPQALIEHVTYPKIKELGGLEAYFVKRNESPLKEGERVNLDLWLERMDWTKLHTLNIERPSTYVLDRLSGDVLPSLRSLSVQSNNFTAVASFLNSSHTSLDSISVKSTSTCSPSGFLSSITFKHGGTLQSLILRHSAGQRSRTGYYYDDTHQLYKYPLESFLNSTDIVSLAHSCHQLAVLEIDFEVGKEWDYKFLDALASMKPLRKLTLKVEEVTRIEPEENLQYWDSESAKRLIAGLTAYLKKHKQGMEFETLDIQLGRVH